MIFDREKIESLERRSRAHFINCLTGFRQPFVVGTVDGEGRSNAAVFNSLTHIGANPPYLGLVFRPVEGFQRDTYENIKEIGEYTCSIVTADFYENAHSTSAKLDSGISEFKACGLEEYFAEGWSPPFVKESPLKIGLQYRAEYPIAINKTLLVVGEIEYVEIDKDAMNSDFDVDISALNAVSIAGLYTYFKAGDKLKRLPYVKPEDIQDADDA